MAEREGGQTAPPPKIVSPDHDERRAAQAAADLGWVANLMVAHVLDHGPVEIPFEKVGEARLGYAVVVNTTDTGVRVEVFREAR